MNRTRSAQNSEGNEELSNRVVHGWVLSFFVSN
jgi:hypothetical protein